VRTALAVLGALLALAGLAGLADAAPPRDPARVGVRAGDFWLVLSRQRVPAGPAVIELENGGEDVHDLRLQRIGGGPLLRVRELRPGRHASIETRLTRGRYRLWCSVGNHRSVGMTATLAVT
jgi:hypothetical protein